MTIKKLKKKSTIVLSPKQQLKVKGGNGESENIIIEDIDTI